MPVPHLLHGGDVDRRLNLRPGSAERLAKRGTLPHVRLPNGAIRFRWSDVAGCLEEFKPARGGDDDEK
jgi:hypothetical protein